MRILTLLTALLAVTFLNAQTIVFEDDFQSHPTGKSLTELGYQLSSYNGYSFATEVRESDGNKFGRVNVTPNGGANFQVAYTIDVEPNCIYTFSVESLGPFKRMLRVLSEEDDVLANTADYKPSTEAEKIAWKKMDLSFVTGATITKVKIAFYHYWSGTIDLDNFKVTKDGAPGEQTSYYVSSTQGSDDNDGTINAPFKTLEKISQTFLYPGDSVLFMRNDTLKGHFVVNGSGTTEEPIFISAYGEGEKPVLTGQVGAEGGGDFAEAIRIENNDNIILDGLEVQNERLVSRSGVADTDAFGISIHNSSNKVMRNLLFQNLKICNVYAAEPMLDKEDFDAIQVSGIRFTSAKNTVAGKEKNIDGVEIKDCFFTDLQRLGVQFRHSGGNAGIGNDSINRNMNIYIHHNEFYYLGGTGVLPNGTYNCLIEHNIFDHPGATTDPRMPGRGSSIWNFKAINTIMQYNMVYSTRGYLDSYGIHIDKHNKNTFVQYNYMEDCIGGFVEILADNEEAVYRFNVSVNSGWRYTEGVSTWKAGSSTIYIYSDRWTASDQSGLMLSDGVYVYNNTVVMNQAFETTFNVDAKNMFIYNNIFSSTGEAKMGYLQIAVRDNETPFNLTHNLYEGNVNPEWIAYDKNPIHGSAEFTGEGNDKTAFELKRTSDAINNGVAITGPAVNNAGYGVFKNIPAYPTVDFYGNPIDLSTGTPNIGACNEKVGVSIKNVDNNNEEWLIYPDSQLSYISITPKISVEGELSLRLLDIKGRVIQNLKINTDANSPLTMPLQSSIKNGIYILDIKGKGVSHSRKMVLYQNN